MSQIYKIISIKNTTELTGSLDAAIKAARTHDRLMQPSYGTQVECDGETVFDTEWPKFKFRTDGESGTITAPDFDNAVKQLNDMFTQQMLEDGAFGWVEDEDGYRHNIGESC